VIEIDPRFVTLLGLSAVIALLFPVTVIDPVSEMTTSSGPPFFTVDVVIGVVRAPEIVV
jgi:hypothetical protein